MTPPEIHILVVDDEPDICTITKEFLDLQGEIVVDTAFSVQGARSILDFKNYDAIICDYMMPVENGIQFLISLRAAGNRIPFILFTGKEREDVVIEALNNGANGYVQKGGNAVPRYKELNHLVRTLVQQKRDEVALRESEERFRDLAEMIPTAVFEMDLGGNLTFLNHFALDLFGYNAHDYANGIEALDILLPEDRERALMNIQEIFQNRISYSHEYIALKKGGATFPIVITSSIILRHGHPVGLRGVVNASLITNTRKENDDPEAPNLVV